MSALHGSVHPRAALRARIRGLYCIADGGEGRNPVALTRTFVDAGCELVQLRCKGWTLTDLEQAAAECVRITRGRAVFIVNDHPEVAARVGADGVHIGQADTGAARAREILGEGALIGISNNTVEELSSSLPYADYVAVGPMFDTPNLSRPKPVRGPDLLRSARALTDLPLVAIGGVTPTRVALLREAGADAWAVIRGVCAAGDPAAAVQAFSV